jgi:ribosomal protein S18 acetylase RimI-like enzyme
MADVTEDARETAPDIEETASGIQAIAATGWGYSERKLLGTWQLRAAGGFTVRANSAWPIGDSGRTLIETLSAVTDWYGARGLTPRVQTIVGSDLDRQIAALGHGDVEGLALRQAAAIAPALAILNETAGLALDLDLDPDLHLARKTELSAKLPADFFTVYRRGLGHSHAAAVLSTSEAQLRFAVVRDADGTALAVGRVAVHATARWAGVAAIHTAERARRRGLARVVLRDLLATAAQSGATRAYLEVEEDNAAARNLYESLGFVTAHRYHCRVVR